MAIMIAVPTVVIGPFAGVFVDRWERRRVMLAADLLRAGLVLGFVVVRSADMVWILYALGFAHASISTFFTPARMAFVPRVVPAGALLAANSLSQGNRVVAALIGGMLAGLCVGAYGTAWPAFTIDALTFLASFSLILGVRARSAPARQDPGAGDAQTGGDHRRPSALSELREGLGVVRGSPMLIGVLVGAGVTMLGLGAVNILFVPLIIRDLHQPATWLGAVEAAETTSMVLAAGLVGVLASRLRPTTPIVLGLAGIAVFCALLAAVTDLWQVLVLLFAVGWLVTPLNASISTVVQLATDDARRGRVAAMLHSVMSLANVLSLGFAGVFGDLLGVRVVFLGAAVIVGIGAVAAAAAFGLADRGAVPVPVGTRPIDGRAA